MRKRWLKRKGCKNVALVDYECVDEEGESYIDTRIEPYYKGKEFRYVSKFERFDREIVEMSNIYYDNESNTLKVVRKL